MTIVKRVKCPVICRCLKLNEEIEVSPVAVYNIDCGWLCKCGSWIKNQDVLHEIILWGLRDGWIDP